MTSKIPFGSTVDLLPPTDTWNGFSGNFPSVVCCHGSVDLVVPRLGFAGLAELIVCLVRLFGLGVFPVILAAV